MNNLKQVKNKLKTLTKRKKTKTFVTAAVTLNFCFFPSLPFCFQSLIYDFNSDFAFGYEPDLMWGRGFVPIGYWDMIDIG